MLEYTTCIDQTFVVKKRILKGLSKEECHCLCQIGFTGCGINPARSFGPAVIVNKSEIWKHHWVSLAKKTPTIRGLVPGMWRQCLFLRVQCIYFCRGNLVQKNTSEKSTLFSSRDES